MPPLADPGLMVRFRAAEQKIAWRPVAGRSKVASVRIAHLHDEEARVESSDRNGETRFRTDSGPVGALVLLMEIDRRGEPTRLLAHEAGAVPGFPSGSLEAVWVAGAVPEVGGLPIPDLVGLARYALA